MKHYIIEPTYKKSLVEKTIFRRTNEEGKLIFLEKELGWRWGSFMISVPETEEEALEFIKSEGYEGDNAVMDWALDYGHTIWDGDKEFLDPDTTVLEMVQSQMMPEETDDFVDITEDYGHAEMLDCWDGCWEFWSARSYQAELTEEEKDAFVEEAEEAYAEEYEEGVEELGWEFTETYFELHCSPKITECDATGQPLDADN